MDNIVQSCVNKMVATYDFEFPFPFHCYVIFFAQSDNLGLVMMM